MPKAALKVCSHPGCNVLSKNARCDKHIYVPERGKSWESDKVRGTRQQRGYGKQWQDVRKYVLSRDRYLCQACLKDNRLTPAKEVDHIINKASGGSDDASNLQAICVSCHRRKTSREGYSKSLQLKR